MLMPKYPMRVYFKRMPNGKLKAKVTIDNLEGGEPVFEGAGYTSEATLLAAIRLTGMIPKAFYAAGIELVPVVDA